MGTNLPGQLTLKFASLKNLQAYQSTLQEPSLKAIGPEKKLAPLDGIPQNISVEILT